MVEEDVTETIARYAETLARTYTPAIQPHAASCLAPPSDPAPEWCVEGAWVRERRRPDVIAQVAVLTPDRRYVRISEWRKPESEGSHVYMANRFAESWEPCSEPEEPSTRYERLLRD
jgi:hypothetical protein